MPIDEIRILHVIRPAAGGMRNHLLSLAEDPGGGRFTHMVACPREMQGFFENRRVKSFGLSIRGDMSVLNDISAVLGLVSVIKNNRINILHAHGSKAGLLGRLAAVASGVGITVFTVHNSIFYEDWHPWKKGVMAAAERWLAGSTDCIITVSEYLRREIIDREGVPPEKVRTIYNGIDIEAFEASHDREHLKAAAGIPGGCMVVGAVARLAPQKGVEFLLKAVANLVERMQIAAVIVGDGPLRSSLEKKAEDLNIGSSVFFMGERSDVARILPCFDVFVLPSVTEGLPLTILEAMASGCPVVASRVGGIPEVLDHEVSGMLVEPGDPDRLASAIERVLADRELSANMSKAGKKLVTEKFSVTRMVGETQQVYLSMAEKAADKRKSGGRGIN